MSSHNDSRPEESDDPFDIPDGQNKGQNYESKPCTLEIQAAGGQYHPTAEQLKVRKPRHRRSGSHGSGYGFASPRISPMRERRVSAHGSPSPRRISQGSFVDFESCNNNVIATGGESSLFPNRLTVHRQSWNGCTVTTTSPDLSARRGSSSSSSTEASEECCHIDDHTADDDILETLDRKVSEVINRCRLNSSSASQGTTGTSDKYGPLSFSYNKKKPSNPSPGSAKRISLTSGMVRFGNDDEDDQVADDSSSSSSQEDGEDQGHWSEDEEGGGGGGGANKPDITPTYSILRKRYLHIYIKKNSRFFP